MTNFARVALTATTLIAAGILLPDDADADQRGRRGPRGARVIARPIGGAYVRPVYVHRPYVGAYRFRGGPWFGGGPFWWPMSYGWFHPPYPPYPYYYGGHYGMGSDARLQVTPPQTEVYIDGALAGVVDQFDGVFQRLRLSPGTHEMALYLDGHRTFVRPVYVAPGSTLKLRHTMEPLGPGEVAEPRPASPPPPPPPASSSAPDATEPPRAGRRLDDRNDRARPTRAGRLVVRVQPADAEVLIDGQRWQTSDTESLLEVSVPAGRVRVEVRKPGHRPFVTDVDVRAGATETLNVSLPLERDRPR